MSKIVLVQGYSGTGCPNCGSEMDPIEVKKGSIPYHYCITYQCPQCQTMLVKHDVVNYEEYEEGQRAISKIESYKREVEALSEHDLAKLMLREEEDTDLRKLAAEQLSNLDRIRCATYTLSNICLNSLLMQY